tara:strand:- start:188 stop:427 length:240 start_codon:yes stop_codon:yes gene_type:complete
MHIVSVDHLEAKTVVLSDGERLQSDTLICCTGCKHRPPVTFVPEAIVSSFGPPLLIDPATTSPLEAHADNEILSRFPAL